MKSLHYISILLAATCINADADASSFDQQLAIRQEKAILPFQGFGGSDDDGFFSVNLANIGVLHVNYRGNYKKGSGYIADFVYDGTGANPEAISTRLTGYSG